MRTKEEIYGQLLGVLEELFEVEPAQVTPELSLIDDLDIDSIDAVDMAVKLNELTGKKIQPAEFKHIRTVQDVVEVIYDLVNPDQVVNS